MSSSSCCILTCIQIFQEADQVVWYSHLFQNFPQLIVIHTVKGFVIVNKAEIDAFLELSCFFHDPADVGNLISGSSAFSKTSLNIRKFTVHILGDLNIGASASILPVNIQCWFPLGVTGLISLQSKGLSRVFSSTTVWKHPFFSVQPSLWSNSHIHTRLLEKHSCD